MLTPEPSPRVLTYRLQSAGALQRTWDRRLLLVRPSSWTYAPARVLDCNLEARIRRSGTWA